MKTEFDDLRTNPNHQYDSDSNGDKQIVRIYVNEQLVAKKVKHKKSIRFFAIDGYQQYLTKDD